MTLLAVTAADAAHGTFSFTAVFIGIALLFANGAFVAAEIALLAARRSKVEILAAEGDPRAVIALRALRELPITFTGAQLGITMCSLGLGAVAEPAVAALFADWLGLTPLPAGAVPIVAFVFAIGLVVFLHMVVGEMAPKNLALVKAEIVALRLARAFGLFITTFRPLILLLNGTSSALLRLCRVEQVDERNLVHTPDELALALAESRQLGKISPYDARVMDAALRLASMNAAAAMTPRVDLAAVPADATLAEIRALAAETGHTRFPVYEETIDHVVGLVNVKDALIKEPDPNADTVAGILRPIFAVPEARDLEHLLSDLIDERHHAAIVIDEHGGTAGMVTLEDIFEELVGDIDDEFDTEQHARRTGEDAWVVPGTMRRDELERVTGFDFGEGDFDTISGAIVEHLGRLVRVGDEVAIGDWRLRVRSLAGRRADEVEVRRTVSA
ncbi:MAG: hemolysin family protein [Nitriliruptoraceae bacterium]